jgi:hypothetical protein
MMPNREERLASIVFLAAASVSLSVTPKERMVSNTGTLLRDLRKSNERQQDGLLMDERFV